MFDDNLNYLGSQYKKRFHSTFNFKRITLKKGATKTSIPLIFGL